MRGNAAVTLQHVWARYGYSFGHKSLLYSLLAYSCRGGGQSTSIDERNTYLLKFRQHSIRALREKTLAESELFAAFFAWVSCRSDDHDAAVVYAKAFVHILIALQDGSSKYKVSSIPSLRYYTLSCVFRHCNPLSLADRNSKLLDDIIPVLQNSAAPAEVFDVRLQMGLPVRFQREDQTDYEGLSWSLLDDIATLTYSFGLICQSKSEGSKPEELVKSVRRNVNDLVSLTCTSKLLQFVNPSAFRCILISR